MKFQVKYADFLPWSSGTEKNVARKALETLIEQSIESYEAFTFTKVSVKHNLNAKNPIMFGNLFQFYVSWEIDDVMGFELARNMSLAAMGVFMVTLVLLGDFVVTCVVLTSVSLAILDTIGMLHLWGVTLNLVSCLDLIMCVGIGVDYSAHVALAILHRYERICRTFSACLFGDICINSDKMEDEENRLRHSLTAIGPAVLNGGVTTFLAAAFVAFAKTEAFVIYFKVIWMLLSY